MTIVAGTKLGPYEITAQVGAGGMGEVYRARDSKLGRDVALKVLPEAFARDAERMARFQREAKVLASLNHPNIAAIHGLEDSSGSYALVMELVEGPTLADRIKRGPIPIDEALKIAKQICEALEYAHERGIVHRDLKPANIKLTNDDAVKVLDFGLAKAIEGDPSSMDISSSPTMSRMATMQGVLLGTAAYMSPEQAKAKSVDRRADIWAFGCVLYEMLTGKMAFTGETLTDTLAAVLTKEPDWSLLPAKTSTRVQLLLQRCLQKDPRQRLRDIGDARISLDEVLVSPLEPSFVAPVAEPRWHFALPWTAAGVAVISALVLAVAFVHFRERQLVAAESVRFQVPLPEKTTMAPLEPFSLSPDGRQLAFNATGSDGVQRLWIRPLDSLDARPLPGSESVPSPYYPAFFWSPNGQYLVFDAGSMLRKRDVSSGATADICSLAGTANDGSWSRDGVILFAEAYSGIMRVSAAGGPASPLTEIDPSRGETEHDFPSFLPDGRHFLYLRLSGVPENRGAYIGSLSAKPGDQSLKRLLESDDSPVIYAPPSDSNLGHLLFVRTGTLFAQPFDLGRLELAGEPVAVAEHIRTGTGLGRIFSASDNGVLVYRTIADETFQLTWFDRQGKVLGTVGEQGPFWGPALSPDETRAVVTRFDPENPKSVDSLWLLDFARGTTARFTFGSFGARFPIWSPDGQRIIFTANHQGFYDLYQKPASGMEDEHLLLQSSQTKYPSSVSPNGRFLLYGVAVGPKYDLSVLPLASDQKPFSFLQTGFTEFDGHFSPDGRWLSYTSDESGRREIYVREFSPNSSSDTTGGGAKWQVSYSGGQESRWSRDGKELYYLTADWKVMAVEVTTSSAFQAGTSRLLFQAPSQPNPFPGDYTVDGKRFLLLAPAHQTSQAPFTVVLNWQAGLKK
jgi:eukaryotic-like serine/threonine-protein kinase